MGRCHRNSHVAVGPLAGSAGTSATKAAVAAGEAQGVAASFGKTTENPISNDIPLAVDAYAAATSPQQTNENLVEVKPR